MHAVGIAAWAFVGFSASLVGSGVLLTHADSLRQGELELAFSAHLHEILTDEHVHAETYCARVTRELRAQGREARPLGELVRDFARFGDGESWGFRDAPDGPETLFVEGPALDTRLSREFLERSTSAPVIVGERAPRLVSACALRIGEERLWLARTRALSTFEAQLHDDASAMGLMLYARARAESDAHVVLTMLGEPSAQTRVYQVDAQRNKLWPLLARALIAAGCAALLCAELARRAARAQVALEDQLLTAIEEAATRIGQGDLSSTMMKSAPGRAERTFRTLDRMTEGLRAAREQLRENERAEAFRELSRHLAHELKNPLFPIRTAVESLRKTRERRPDEFDEVFEETTRVVLEEVQRLEHIVREFGEFARLPAPVLTRIDLRGLVDDVVSLHGRTRVSASGAGAHFVRADREQIMQLLTNLVLNALDASPADASVLLSIEQGTQGAALHVDDRGPGVAEDARERVFEPYYTTKESGTGLGLAIARRIAREHGGDLTVTRSPLGGARFTLKLPSDESTNDSA